MKPKVDPTAIHVPLCWPARGLHWLGDPCFYPTKVWHELWAESSTLGYKFSVPLQATHWECLTSLLGLGFPHEIHLTNNGHLLSTSYVPSVLQRIMAAKIMSSENTPALKEFMVWSDRKMLPNNPQTHGCIKMEP